MTEFVSGLYATCPDTDDYLKIVANEFIGNDKAVVVKRVSYEADDRELAYHPDELILVLETSKIDRLNRIITYNRIAIEHTPEWIELMACFAEHKQRSATAQLREALAQNSGDGQRMFMALFSQHALRPNAPIAFFSVLAEFHARLESGNTSRQRDEALEALEKIGDLAPDELEDAGIIASTAITRILSSEGV